MEMTIDEQLDFIRLGVEAIKDEMQVLAQTVDVFLEDATVTAEGADDLRAEMGELAAVMALVMKARREIS